MNPLKKILLWVLLLAIPLQGLAGNAMTICKASHQRVTQTSAFHPSMQHHGIDGHGVKHDHQQHFSQPGDAGDMPAHDSSTLDQQLSSCSACAACSMGTSWITSYDAVFSAFVAPSDIIAYFAFHVPGVVPERPEHPPRVSLV